MKRRAYKQVQQIAAMRSKEKEMVPMELRSICQESPFWKQMSEVEKEMFAEEFVSMYGDEFGNAIFGDEGLPYGMHIERQGTDRWIL